MGDGFVIAVFFLHPVPDGQSVPQMAVSEIVPGFRFGFLNRFFLCFFLYPFGFFDAFLCVLFLQVVQGHRGKIKGKLAVCLLPDIPALLFGEGASRVLQPAV